MNTHYKCGVVAIMVQWQDIKYIMKWTTKDCINKEILFIALVQSSSKSIRRLCAEYENPMDIVNCIVWLFESEAYIPHLVYCLIENDVDRCF